MIARDRSQARRGRRSTPDLPRPCRCWVLAAAVAALLTPAIPADLLAASRPGPGALVAAGGGLTAPGIRGYCSVGQAVTWSATGGEWSTSTGTILPVIDEIAVDFPPPAIDPVVAGDDHLPIDVELNSRETPQRMSIHYRLAGRPDYTTIEMARDGEGHWAADIPVGSAGLRGLEYYLEAQMRDRRAFSPASDPTGHPWQVPVHVTDYAGNGALRTSPGIYRMISIPAHLDDPALASLLVDDLGAIDVASWRCGRWDPANRAYAELGVDQMPPVAAGQAFWLRTRAARSVGFTGATAFADRPDGFGVGLEPGWNQIGSPFAYGVRVTDSLVDDGTQVRPFAEAVAAGMLEAAPLHHYNGRRYVQTDTILDSYQGYFVANLTSQPITLVLPTLEAVPADNGKIAPAGPEESLDWQVLFSARREGALESDVELATSPLAQRGWDRWDRLQAPLAPGQAISLCVVGDSLPPGIDRLQRDARPSGQMGESWILELSATGSEPVDIAWTIPDGSGESPVVRLVDLQVQRYVDCRSAGSYAVRPTPEGRRLLVVAGSAEWVESQTASYLPFGGHFATAIAGASPSRDGTQIRLALEAPERVGFSVFDVSGRMVHRAEARNLPPGVHILSWEGRGSHGRRVPSGVYFIRVASPHRSATLRSVIVR